MTPNHALSATLAARQANFANPYRDPYEDFMNQLWGTLSLIDGSSQSITSYLYASNGPTESNRRTLEEELTSLDQKLNRLTSAINENLAKGLRPSGVWNKDNLISKCSNLIKEFTAKQNDPDYQKHKEFQWHFKGTLQALEQVQTTLLACTKQFGSYSIYVQSN